MKRCVVLGRFQPFHLGHAGLVQAAAEHAGGGEVVVAVGSAQAGWEANNPWTAEERGAMIEAWAESANLSVPWCTLRTSTTRPVRVEHATQGPRNRHAGDLRRAHREPLCSSGVGRARSRVKPTHDAGGLARPSNGFVMLSTVMDDEATREVLSASVPSAVIEWLIENDAVFRCSTFETGVHAG